MAYPTTSDPTTSADTTSTYGVLLPASIPAGALILICTDWNNNPGVTTPTGYVIPTNGSNQAGGNQKGVIFAKVADGTEGGTTVQITADLSTNFCAHVYVINDWYGSLPDGLAVANRTSTASTPADCPNLSPGWGVLDILWIAFSAYSESTGVDTTATAAPTNYTNLVQNTQGLGSGGVRAISARRNLNASSENPGAFTHVGNTGLNAGLIDFTIAIRPAGDITLTPSVVSSLISVPAPIVTRQQFVNPTPLAVALVIATPSVVTVSLVPSAVTVPLSIPAPVISQALTLSPTPMAVPLVAAVPLVVSDRVLTPAPVAVPLNVAVPALSGVAIVTPAPVAVPLVLVSPSLSLGSISIASSPRTIPLVAPVPSLMFSRVLTPSPLAIAIQAVTLSTGISGGGGIQIFTEHRPGLSYVYLYEPDGTLVANDLTPLHYRINRYQNRIGDWSVDIPVDEIVGVLPVARQLGAGWKISVRQEGFNPNHAANEGFLLYQGIVETRQFRLSAGGQSMLSLTGSFRELTMVRRSIGLGYEYDTTLAGFTNDLVSTLLGEGDTAIYPAAAAGIPLSGVFTEPLSRYAAWLKGLASARYNVRESWDHDRPELTPYDGPPNPGIVLRKLYADEDRYLHENGETGVGLIAGEPTIRYDGSALYNRIIAYGTDTVVDPADATKTVTGSLTLEFATYSLPYVVQNDVNPDGTTYYYIEDAASIALYGLIEHVLIRPDIKNPNNLSASRAQAANVLYWTAVNDLIKHRSEKVSVAIGPLANGAHIWNLPGDQSWVKYEGEVLLEGGAAIWLDLEKRFVLVERHDESHPSGVRRVDFVLTAPEMEFEVGDLPEVINPFDPEGPTLPELSFPPMPPLPEIPGLDVPELEVPEIPGITEPNEGPPEGGGGGVVTGQLRLTDDDVLEYWDGEAWQNVEARLGTSDPGGGALWLEPP